MTGMYLRSLATGLAIATLIATTVGKAEITTLFEERKAGMTAMASAARAIDEMFRGARTYSPESLAAAARSLRDNSGDAMRSRFPDDSLGAPSAARPEIAANRDEFDRIADRLETLAAHFSEFATSAPEAITDDMRMGNQPMTGGSLLGARSRVLDDDVTNMPAEHVFHLILETCTSCHARFRTRQ